MENSRTLTQFELNIVELFERLQNAYVSEDDTFKGTFYVEYNGFNNDWVTESREDLLNYCIDGINQWYSETDAEDMLNNDFILESNLDYLQLLLTLPSGTTVLAVGQGCVAAPSTTTAYLHESANGYKLLAVYDYENEDVTEQMKTDLEELFPSAKYFRVSFGVADYSNDYETIVKAEDRKEAIKKAMDEFCFFVEDKTLWWNYISVEEVTIPKCKRG